MGTTGSEAATSGSLPGVSVGKAHVPRDHCVTNGSDLPGPNPVPTQSKTATQFARAHEDGFLQQRVNPEAMALLNAAMQSDPQLDHLFHLGLNTLQGKGPGDSDSVSSKDDAVFYTPESTPVPEPSCRTNNAVPDDGEFSFPTMQPNMDAINSYNQISALRAEVTMLEQRSAVLRQNEAAMASRSQQSGSLMTQANAPSSSQLSLPLVRDQLLRMRKTIDSSKVVAFYAKEGVREIMRIQADVGAFWLTYESQLKGDYKAQWNAVRAGFKDPYLCASFVAANMAKIIKMCPPAAHLVQSSPPTSLIADLARANPIDGSSHQATSGMQRNLDALNGLRGKMQTHGNVSTMVAAALSASHVNRDMEYTAPTELFIAFYAVVEAELGAPLPSEVPLWGLLAQGKSDELHPKVPLYESSRDWLFRVDTTHRLMTSRDKNLFSGHERPDVMTAFVEGLIPALRSMARQEEDRVHVLTASADQQLLMLSDAVMAKEENLTKKALQSARTPAQAGGGQQGAHTPATGTTLHGTDPPRTRWSRGTAWGKRIMSLVAAGHLPATVVDRTKEEVDVMMSQATSHVPQQQQLPPTVISQIQAIAMAAMGQVPPCADPLGIMHPPRGQPRPQGQPGRGIGRGENNRPQQPGNGQQNASGWNPQGPQNNGSYQGGGGAGPTAGQPRPRVPPRRPCPICNNLLTNVPPHYGDECPLAAECQNLLIKSGKLPAPPGPQQNRPLQGQALLGWAGQDANYYGQQSFNFPPSNSHPALPPAQNWPRGRNFMIVASLGGEDGSCPIPDDGWDESPEQDDEMDELIRGYHSLATTPGASIEALVVPKPGGGDPGWSSIQNSLKEQMADYTAQGNRLLSQIGQAMSAAGSVEFVKARKNQFPLSFSVAPVLPRDQRHQSTTADQHVFPQRYPPPQQTGMVNPWPQAESVKDGSGVRAGSAGMAPTVPMTRQTLPYGTDINNPSASNTRLQASKARATALGNQGESQIREIAVARPRSFTPANPALIGPWGMPTSLLATLSQEGPVKMVQPTVALCPTQTPSEASKTARVAYFRSLGKTGGGLSYFLNPPQDPTKQVGLLIKGEKVVINKTLLDFGSNISLLGDSTAKALGLAIHPSPLKLTTSTEVDSTVMGCTDVIPISYGDGENEVITHHSFLVSREHPGLPYSMLLGTPDSKIHGQIHDQSTDVMWMKPHWQTLGEAAKILGFPLHVVRP